MQQGKAALVQVAEELVQTGMYSEHGLSEEVVEQALSRLGHNFQDPELVIVFCSRKVCNYCNSMTSDGPFPRFCIVGVGCSNWLIPAIFPCIQVLSLFEFPPWRTSLCEILPGGHLRDVTRSTVRGILQRYAGTVQRFGT